MPSALPTTRLPRLSIPLVLCSLLAWLAVAWGVLALWYQVPVDALAIRAAVAALWAVLTSLVLIRGWRKRRWGGLVLVTLAFAALLVWWNTLQPSNDRDWADDVAQTTTGTVQGNIVTLSHVRDFDWRSENHYTPRWETRSYDLDRLQSVDMILSYWMGPAIAHTLVSFGFEDGEQLVFSVEIRKERNESFSAIGGFFKKFETSVIAASERDIVRVRTNARGEDDYLYRIDMQPDAMRSLFLAYIDEANALARTPQFYNTLTANCTTIVYHMVQRIIYGLPLDYRLVLSGYLPSYVYEVGGLIDSVPLEELTARGRITERARAADRDPDFSALIRNGVPGIEPPEDLTDIDPAPEPVEPAPPSVLPDVPAPSDAAPSPTPEAT
ncbi:DUF4105 domain-containing protein [Pigmentiphaga aceris]|uniref:DUF4105 domain-containing protein n=1 Tax=Pigmentiphaga aceris TaxID=1940612 RepID=A0A5C0B3A4_9BURK|nr:DUF4105 domain-containing protein [Pigmentiphaga aceris]QEI08153.1 DUF4105 domain-containing protein [Pigmentiphaga aceris]